MKVSRPGSPFEVLFAFAKLGVSCFGGPIAHIGYFREEFVVRRRWLDERSYADLVGLCSFLPGPASSQVGFSLGLKRAGWLGGLAAWTGFTLPSAIVMTLFAFGAGSLSGSRGAGLLHGLKLVAAAIVAQAVFGMARSLCPDRRRASIAVVSTLIVLSGASSATQVAAILMGAVAGLWLCRGERPAVAGLASKTPTQVAGLAPQASAVAEFLPQTPPVDAGPIIQAEPAHAEPILPAKPAVSRRAGLVALAIALGLLLILACWRGFGAPQGVALFEAFYRSGALVFGGGHVVLPLLREAFVAPGWISDDVFLAGYGAAQAVPGPLFTFAAYLGAAVIPSPHGPAGAALGLAAIFLPGLLALVAALPFWEAFRTRPGSGAVMRGVNASVVGLLAAALYNPVWTGAVKNTADFGIVLAGFVLLTSWRAPPLVVVVLCTLGGVVTS